MTQEQLIAAVQEIHSLTNQGQALAAMEKYYGENVVMIESNGDTTTGLAANLEREKAFFSAITEVREMKILDTFVYCNAATKECTVVTTSSMDFNMGETVVKGSQVSITTWEDEKVVKEQFIYHSF
jgi:ribosomal protein S12 methylthiotransferase accessory factor YcaO